MKHLLKRLLISPVFIVGFAFALRMIVMCVLWRHAPTPIKANPPFGFELGRVARAIAAGEGFSSPLRDMDTGPTAWFTPICASQICWSTEKGSASSISTTAAFPGSSTISPRL